MNTLVSNIAHSSSGQTLDVTTFLETLDEFATAEGLTHGQGGRNVIRRAIRMLNVTVHDHNVTDPSALASLYADLHKLEDALDSIKDAD